MTRRCLLAVSPHLDDAVFSAGGTLARCARRGWRVVVVTCFTGNVPRPIGFALACQLDKGLGADIDYMALRRAEDRAACAAIGAEPVHLPFLEAPHRGYADAAALFGERRADDDRTVLPMLTEALRELIAREAPAMLLGPIGLGGHVDHGVVRSALDALAAFGAPVRRPRRGLWQDWPYVDRAPAGPGLPGATVDGVIDIRFDPADRQRLIAGCSAYTSQLGFQFGSAARMIDRLQTRTVERFQRAA